MSFLNKLLRDKQLLDFKQCTTIEQYVKDIALPKGKYHFHKDLAGRLTGYVPKAGQIAVLSNYTELAKVIKSPNFIKDFVIETESGARFRKNLVNNDIDGYIDV